MILIEIDGKRQFVDSLSGCEGAAVIAENVEPSADPEAELVDGQWAVPIATLKARKRAEVDAQLAARFALGFSPATGPLSGHVLQVRDGVDRTNWLTSQAAYREAIAAGFGDVVDASFRTAANETVVVTYQEGFDALMAMASWGRALMGRSWALKDAIAAMAAAAEVEAFDVAAAWTAP